MGLQMLEVMIERCTLKVKGLCADLIIILQYGSVAGWPSQSLTLVQGWIVMRVDFCVQFTTVKTLLTHSFLWTVQAMGFQRLWVGGGEKKISAQES